MRSNSKSLILWCIGSIFMTLGGIFKFSSSLVSGQSINDIASSMPKSIQAVLGIGSFDLSKASGYYGMLFIYLAVMATIHSSMLGANIISKEERDKTSEFLFVKPRSRNKIIAAKLSAAFANIILFNLATATGSLAAFNFYAKGENINSEIYILMVAMLILQLIFMAIGTFFSAFNKNSKAAASKATALLLVTFIMAKAMDFDSRLEFLKYLTPFKYFEAKDLIYGANFDPVSLILSFVIIVSLLAATFIFFKRRDLNI